MSRELVAVLLVLAIPVGLSGQTVRKFPPDSLINTKVIPKSTPVMQVVGQMRDFAGGLGVRCQFCHVGEEGKPLDQFDFPKDDKRTKLVARQMMRMVQEINHRLDTLPERPSPSVEVTCRTCHRGVSRPVPLSALIQEAAMSGGADSAVGTYRRLREQYLGRDAYDFGEGSLNAAALRLGREHRPAEALALLTLNEEFYPGSSGMYIVRGNVLLLGGDTTGAATAYREALRRDPKNGEARGRLREIGQTP